MEYIRLKNQLTWAWRNTAGFRRQIAMRIFLDILSLAFTLSFVYWSKKGVDIATNAISGSLRITLVYIVLSVLMSLLLGAISSWMSESVKIKMTIRLQNSLLNAQMLTAWKHTQKWHTGDLLVRMNADCNEVTQVLSGSFPSFVVSFVKLIASVCFLWIMDPMLAWMILCISPLFLFSKFYYKKVRKLSQDAKQADSRLGIVIQENLRNRLLIRALQAIDIRKKKFFDMQQSVLSLKMKQLSFSVTTQTIIRLTFNGGYLLAFLWGIYRLHSHEITFGTMTAFLQLVAKIQTPILSMIAFLPAAIRCTTSIDRLTDLYEGEEKDDEPQEKVENIQQLSIEHITFRYDDEMVINDFSMQFYPGKPVAVLGSSGKGKTTLLRLILALVKPESGNIYLISDKTKHLVSKATLANFAYVPQGNSLFSGTIRENLLIVKPLASDEDLQRVLEIACAEFVFSLPEGLDALVGEMGFGFSEGQAQRIAIARTLLRNSEIWLLDEITSALDSNTAKKLIENLMEAGKEKMMIFVTHDNRLADACTQIVHLN